MTFKRAIKTESKLRLALSGPAGSGKTYTALLLARELADGKPVAVIDTERGSASKYADLFEFDVLELAPPYHPDRYIAALRDAEGAGYGVLVIDSLSHAWTGQGGLLEVHEQVVRRQATKNTYTAWAEVTPIQNRFIDAMTGASLHVIATMRAKADYVQDQGANGRTQIRKVGTAPIQRDGMEFEFDVLGEMDQDNTLVVSKTRCPALAGAVIAKPGQALAETLRVWLAGAKPEPTPMTQQPERHAVVTPLTPVVTTASPHVADAVNLTYGSLRLRGRKIGYKPEDAWRQFVEWATGKSFPADVNRWAESERRTVHERLYEMEVVSEAEAEEARVAQAAQAAAGEPEPEPNAAADALDPTATTWAQGA